MASQSSSSPCAACKYLRRRCTQECVFAPYFPPDHPQKFAYVHRVFGASNVSKLLNELSSNQREDAVNSLFYEAETRLRDPVYGCVGLISILQQRYKEVQAMLQTSREELATYVGPQAMLPIPQPQPHFTSLTQQQQQQILEAQQLEAVLREQQNEMFRAFGGGSSSSQHHQQNQVPQGEILRFHDGFDSVPTGPVTVTELNQLSSGGTTLALSGGGNFAGTTSTVDNYHNDQQLHHHPQQYHEAKLFISTQSSQPQPQETQTQPDLKSEEDASLLHLGNYVQIKERD